MAALAAQEAMTVRLQLSLVTSQRTPRRAEITAARRAADRLAPSGQDANDFARRKTPQAPSAPRRRPGIAVAEVRRDPNHEISAISTDAKISLHMSA
jgi:hypothetical protein